ncbi:MAG: iron ABC transporter permease [Desulfamplus sp.]|nr:iron ABC transporter permease [Desulfamplus sp.]
MDSLCPRFSLIKKPVLFTALVPLVFLLVFYFYPLGGIFIRSFMDHGDFSLTRLLKVFNSPRMAGIVTFTFWQASLSTLMTLCAALPCAWVMGSFDFRGKKLIMTLATLPFVLPTIVVASAFQALLGKGGIMAAMFPFYDGGLEGSLGAILLAHVFYNFSIVLRVTSGFLSSMGKDISQAGSMLGASPLQVFIKVVLPVLMPAITGASLLVFIFCFSSFGVVMILGGPAFSTIEVEIYRQAAHLFNLPVAAMLCLLQVLFNFLMMWLYASLQVKAAQFLPKAEGAGLKKPVSILQKLMVGLCTLFIIIFCTLPIAGLFLESLWHNGGPSLIYYRELFFNTSGSIFYISPVDAVFNSLLFALAALCMSLVTGGCAAYFIRYSNGRIGDFFDSLFMLPLSTSAVTLGFGIIITLDKPPLNLRTSLFLIPILHTLVAFPFVVRVLLPALRAIPSSLKDAAVIMGASPFRVWMHVELPIIARALSVGAIFAFTISLGEFGATLFAARPEFATLPVTIYKFLGQPGTMNRGQAMALSSILMLVTAAAFILMETVREKAGHNGF